VFPDEAVLPAVSNTDLGGGGSGEAAGATAEAGSPVASGGAGNGGLGGTADAGAAGTAEPGGGAAGEAGAGEAGAGEAGAGGAGATCDDPHQLVVPVREDTWIDAANADANHRGDARLFVNGGAAERRTLFKIDVPAAPAGGWLVKATLDFNLESNQDESLVQRALGLYRLTRDYSESKVTWLKFTNGAKNDWDAPGGDFGGILARATLPAETSAGTLSFDVTAPLRSVYSAQAVPLALIIREVGAPPFAPAALAFTSSGGNASKPALTIEYCEP
jgi:hypothetical protein